MAFLELAFNYVVPFLVVLSILVFVHEGGHYLAARWAGVRVEAFSIGFGPEIRGWEDRHGTRWKVSWIPLGGYVRMYGEGDEDDGGNGDGTRDPATSFRVKTVFQRAVIVAAGPLANFIFAVLVFAALFLAVGRPVPEAAVGFVEAGSAAARAGFVVGDRIVAVDGEDVRWFEDLRRAVAGRGGKRTSFAIERDGAARTLVAIPEVVEIPDADGTSRAVGRLGVGPDPARIGHLRLGPLDALDAAFTRAFAMTAQILGYLGGVVSGAQPADELGGPIRIAQISGEMAQAGLFNLVFFGAVLSLNLALINLLPIPMLDGGHLLFLAVEAARGRPLTPRIQEYSFRFGLILVLLVLVFATWNDLGGNRLFD